MYSTYTLYNLVDVRWDVLSDIMSSYYLHIYQVLGLNGVQTGERVLASSEGDPNARLSFTNSETAPFILTPLQGNILLQGTSTLSYYFHLDDDDLAIGGVVHSGVDTWLYVNSNLEIVMGRYLGRLIMKKLWTW